MTIETEPPRLDATSEEPAFLREVMADARRERPASADLARLAGRVGAATGVLLAPPSLSGPPATGASGGGGGATAWWTGTAAKVGLASIVVAGAATWWATAATPAAPVASGAASSATSITSAPTAHVTLADATSVDDVPVEAPAAPAVASVDAPPPARAAPSGAAAPTPSPRIDAEAPERVEPATPSTTASAVAPREPETALLERARRALAASPASALAVTDEHVRAYPAGTLSQEREVIAITALASLGRREDAARRADRFRVAFPSSAYVRRLDALLGQPADQRSTR